MSSTISVTRALAELKTLYSRIEKLVNSTFITTMVAGDPLPLEMTMRSNWDSVNALIARYRAVKFAILQSNSVTKVKIGGTTYTVAEAIALKESSRQEQMLLDSLRNQRLNVLTAVESHNHLVRNKLDSLMEINFKERKTSEEDMKVIQEAYLKNNEIKVIDPLKLELRLSDLENKLDEFLSNVDFCLSESNAITTITV